MAATIRRSIELRLLKKHGYVLPEPESFDDEVLRTIIKKYNPKSYEFNIKSLDDNNSISRAHMFFGKRPQAKSQDKFSHLYFPSLRGKTVVESLDFFLRRIDRKHLYDQSESGIDKFTQQSLF